MASYDGSRSLQMGCDVFYDHECGPCSVGGTRKEASHYCTECQDYLCDSCKGHHRNLAITRNHNIVSGSKVPTSASGSPGMRIACGCNKNQPIEFYCEIHKDVVCSPCKSFHHQKCKIYNIKQKSSAYKSSTLDSVLSEIQSLKNKYDRLKQEYSGNGKDVKRLKEACKKEIKTFRKELDTCLDKLEKNMLTELDKWEGDESRRIDQNISDLTTALKVVESDCKLLEDAKQDDRKEIMFTADVQVSKVLQSYQSKLGELETGAEKPSLAFERNKTLDNLITVVKSLGFLKTQHMGSDRDDRSLKTVFSGRKVLLGRNVLSRSQLCVKTVDDKNSPYVSSCTVMPNGHVVLCDRDNNKIKLLDGSTSLVESLKFSGAWDVSVLDTNNVIITIPDYMRLQVVQVFPHMKAGRTIQLNKKCWGVEVSRDEIYITCHNNPGEGEVRVLDINGKLKRRLGVGQDGSFMFTFPCCITVNVSGEKIFVSDGGTHTITCMTVDGDVVYKYKDGDLRCPYGLYCDSGDNILVCGCVSDNVQVITADSKKNHILVSSCVQVITADGETNRTLLSSGDGLQYPCSIAYRDSDDSLLVGCQDMKDILIFQLTK